MSTPYGLQITESCVICKLRNSGFFCDLPKNSLQDLDRIKYASAFPQGSVLFVEGQAPRGIYILCSGRVKLTTTSRDGKTLILRIANAGEVLGLHGTVSGKPYELTAEPFNPASSTSSSATTSSNFCSTTRLPSRTRRSRSSLALRGKL